MSTSGLVPVARPASSSRARYVSNGIAFSSRYTPEQFTGIMRQLYAQTPLLQQKYSEDVFNQITVTNKGFRGLLRFESDSIPTNVLKEIKMDFSRAFRDMELPEAQASSASEEDAEGEVKQGEAAPIVEEAMKEKMTKEGGKDLDLSEMSLDEIRMLAPFIGAEAIRTGRQGLTKDVLARVREESPIIHPTIPDPVREPRRLA